MLQLEFNVRHAPLNVADGPSGHRPRHRPGRARSERRPTRGPFGVGGQSPPLRQRAVRVRRRRRRVREARPDRVGPPAPTRWLRHRRARDLDDARKAGDLHHRVGGGRPVVGGGRAHRGRHSSWRPASTSSPHRCRRRSCTPRCCPRVPSTWPSSRWTPARTRARWATSSRRRPTVTGGAQSQDWSGFDDPKIDALFSQAVQDLAPPSAQLIYQQIDQALWTAMPTLPLFAEPTMLVWSSSLSGVDDDPGGLGPLWNVRLWALRSGAPARRSTSAGSGRRGVATLALECSMRRTPAHTRRSGGIGRRASLRG